MNNKLVKVFNRNYSRGKNEEGNDLVELDEKYYLEKYGIPSYIWLYDEANNVSLDDDGNVTIIDDVGKNKKIYTFKPLETDVQEVTKYELNSNETSQYIKLLKTKMEYQKKLDEAIEEQDTFIKNCLKDLNIKVNYFNFRNSNGYCYSVCNMSPFGCCVYLPKDRSHDNCIFCHLPKERK